MSNYLFAIDEQTQEVIVSESPKGSIQIHQVERIWRQNNEVLYLAVSTLCALAQAPDLDEKIFKAMDKVCQLIYVNSPRM